MLAPGIELLRALQETFWATLYPLIEEGEDLELRMITVETAGRLITAAVRKAPLTRSGLSLEDYLESRVVGYEKDATTDAKQEARKDAIEHGKLTAEDFDQAFAASPKSLYVEAEAALAESLQATERLDEFQPGGLRRQLPQSVEAAGLGWRRFIRVAELLLNERRKTEPDPVPVAEEAGCARSRRWRAGDRRCRREASGEPVVRRRTVTSGQLGAG